MGVDNSKCIDSLLLSVVIFVTNLFIHHIENQRFNNFKQISSQGFLCDLFNVHRIRYDYRFIEIISLNFFNNKFSIKSTFLKVKGALNSAKQIRLRYFSLLLSLVPFFYRYNFDKFNVSKTNVAIVFGQKINDFKVKG